MATTETFMFEPQSDDEIAHEAASDDEEEDQNQEDECEFVLREVKLSNGNKSQSPLDLSAFPESVYEEYHHQEEYWSEKEDDDEVPTTTRNDKNLFFSHVEGVSFKADSFAILHISRPLRKACEALGYSKPTPIQAACIPFALTGRDICGSALTGSGKTAAFVLPTLERLFYRPKNKPAIRVLIVTPTRELAVQVHSMTEQLAQFMPDIRSCLVIGGVRREVQESALKTQPDIVVATPGRMIDHLRNSMSVLLDELEVLVLDEADRLLEVGFSDEIHELVKFCPKRRQTMLFSATMTEKVDDLIKLSLRNPLRLSADSLTERPLTLTEDETKKEAHRLKIIFGLVGFKAAELHGDLTQPQRLEACELFKNQKVDFLIATDVAARGLDINDVQTVINFECPWDLNSYVHRVGRTARAGREGYAVTFVTDDDRSLLKDIAKGAGRLKKRTVDEQSIMNWSQMIEQLEEKVNIILQEERVEMALRKAEMEVKKVENIIAHQYEIHSRPKKTWFVTEKGKKLLAKAAKIAVVKVKGSCKKIVSAEQAEELKILEKRKREHEKNLPRKMRRKLEAAREMLEDENEVKKTNRPFRITKSRAEEMVELFQDDMSKKRQKKTLVGGNAKSKPSFKRKSRYKRK